MRLNTLLSRFKYHFRTVTLLAGVGSVALLTGSATPPPPSNVHDTICDIIKHDPHWYHAAKKSQDKWGTSIPILKAFVYQESRFVHNARPPREYAGGFIPLPRKSSAYGYAQAQDPAWEDYQKATGNRTARRTNKYDALDFIGWYNSVSNQRNRIALNDPYNLYLAYHEGHGGYNRKTFEQKPWLKDVAVKVRNQSKRYEAQLRNCKVPSTSCVWPFCGT